MAFFSSKKNKDTAAVKAVAQGVKATKVAKSVKMPTEKVAKTEKVVAKTAETKAISKSVVAGGASFDLSHNLASMILRPRVTEKATMSAEKGVYVFEVSKDSSKDKIAKAISAMYKVTPTKVRIVNLPSKSVFVRGKWGNKSPIKKAYIYLKKGDKIEII